MELIDQQIADCVNRCKTALATLPTDELWEIFSNAKGLAVSQAKVDFPNRLRAWLLAEICHHVCDPNYDQGAQEVGKPSDPSLGNVPSGPKA